MATGRALVFPGQGSQAVGMGSALAAAFPLARQVFEEVDDALGSRLSTIIAEGPEAELTLTANAQPALMAVSVAVVRVLLAESGRGLAAIADRVAGHSLGEYAALTAAGTLTLADAARLLRLRGQAMQAAVPVGEGAMAAILMLEIADVEAIAADAARATGAVCDVANDNAPGQVVVSGAKAAVEKALQLAAERGAKRSVMLPVSAPFHCRLMQPAADAMAAALQMVTLAPPAVPLVANVSAAATGVPETIRQNLVAQVCGRVRWRESVLALKRDGIASLVECGAGKVLTGLTRRIDKDLTGVSVGVPADIEATLAML